MSCVHNILLCCDGEDYIEDEGWPNGRHLPVLDPLNEWLEQNQLSRHLEEIGHHSGGYKWMETEVFGFAGNYLDTREFLNRVSQLDWKYPDNVRVLIQRQDEECFTMYTIKEILDAQASSS